MLATGDRSGSTAWGSGEERRKGMLFPFRIQLELYTEAVHSPCSPYVNTSPGTQQFRIVREGERCFGRVRVKRAVECRRESEERERFLSLSISVVPCAIRSRLTAGYGAAALSARPSLFR